MKFRFASVNLGAVAALISVAGCVAPDTGTPARPPADPTYQTHENRSELESMADRVHALINSHRTNQGLRPLRRDARLDALARVKSADMAQGGPFTHVGFDQRRRAMNRLIPNYRVAENLAYNRGDSSPPARAMRSWLDSRSHRMALEYSSFRITGIGVAKAPNGSYYFTQLFVLPKP